MPLDGAVERTAGPRSAGPCAARRRRAGWGRAAARRRAAPSPGPGPVRRSGGRRSRRRTARTRGAGPRAGPPSRGRVEGVREVVHQQAEVAGATAAGRARRCWGRSRARRRRRARARRVGAATASGRPKTRETVAIDTPARRATSWTVGMTFTVNAYIAMSRLSGPAARCRCSLRRGRRRARAGRRRRSGESPREGRTRRRARRRGRRATRRREDMGPAWRCPWSREGRSCRRRGGGPRRSFVGAGVAALGVGQVEITWFSWCRGSVDEPGEQVAGVGVVERSMR